MQILYKIIYIFLNVMEILLHWRVMDILGNYIDSIFICRGVGRGAGALGGGGVK